MVVAVESQLELSESETPGTEENREIAEGRTAGTGVGVRVENRCGDTAVSF